MTKKEMEARIAELEAELATAGGNDKHTAALQEIARLGGRQGSIAADALK